MTRPDELVAHLGLPLRAVDDRPWLILGSAPDPRLPDFAGDAVLICTDGLAGIMEPARMADFLARATDSQNACDMLLDAALATAARDNITVAVCYF